ncbi:PH domain-containing protein [Parapedobacter sp. ISTM3]|uniref:Short C-terminal domain-containing protein n=1 Tax=Parapedobacter luteus TaxID=623280 RepID=A0A1T5FF72_9SPHI|nr:MULTISPECIES: PH domain-containing protein [Parapedobacter]MBK1441455.1 PH domain-containing protein [Parapedobacter sp. ISTM3]SKB94718.1 Short C-terminal domain-containing protein [Parapedobacter luteus]
MNIDRYINDGQDPKVAEKLLLKLQDMLTAGEHIHYIAVQKMPAVTLFPDSIAVTDRRIFFCKSTKLGLATDFEIFQWNHVLDLSFKEGVLGAKVIVKRSAGEEPYVMGYIPKNQARKLYQWGNEALEKQRRLEKQADEEPTLKIMPVNEQEDELTLKLKKLKSLFERQLITQAEYETKKNELLSQL